MRGRGGVGMKSKTFAEVEINWRKVRASCGDGWRWDITLSGACSSLVLARQTDIPLLDQQLSSHCSSRSVLAQCPYGTTAKPSWRGATRQTRTSRQSSVAADSDAGDVFAGAVDTGV